MSLMTRYLSKIHALICSLNNQLPQFQISIKITHRRLMAFSNGDSWRWNRYLSLRLFARFLCLFPQLIGQFEALLHQSDDSTLAVGNILSNHEFPIDLHVVDGIELLYVTSHSARS